MRPLEASCANNCAGTVNCFSISGPAQLYYILKPSFDCADQQDTHVRTHRQTNLQTDRHTHTHTIHAHSRHCHPSSCSEAAVNEKQNNAVLCLLHCICNVYCMLYSAYYTVPCILYIMYSGNFGSVQIFVYFVLSLVV